jgi:hypothetical protein
VKQMSKTILRHILIKKYVRVEIYGRDEWSN